MFPTGSDRSSDCYHRVIVISSQLQYTSRLSLTGILEHYSINNQVELNIYRNSGTAEPSGPRSPAAQKWGLPIEVNLLSSLRDIYLLAIFIYK